MGIGDTQEIAVENTQQAIRSLRAGLKRQYDRSVNKDLSKQQWMGLFQRNIELVLGQFYQDVLKVLRSKLSALEGADASLNSLLQELDGVVEELIEYALQKHQSSCALSNFPEEHQPSQEYLSEVIRESAMGWTQFKAQVDALLAETVRA